MPTIRIPLHSRKYPGRFTLIDEEDYELVNQYRWCPNVRPHTTYAVASPGLRLHRLILGVSDSSILVDHINHDGLDNRRDNLRVASTHQNIWNSRPRGGSSSRFRGVRWHPRAGRWCVANSTGGVAKDYGSFLDEVLAGHVADRVARKVYGEYAYLNFPDSPITDQELDAWIERDRELRRQIDHQKRLGNTKARKLTEEQVEQIRRRYQKGVPGSGCPALAREFGVSTRTIQFIINGETWR